MIQHLMNDTQNITQYGGFIRLFSVSCDCTVRKCTSPHNEMCSYCLKTVNFTVYIPISNVLNK